MARRVSRRSQDEQIIHTWWLNAGLAAVFLLVAYGLASLAIDSGRLWQYALTLIFFGWAVNRLIASIRYAMDR